MGMNYYLKDRTAHGLGLEDELYHLGKKSVGWNFSFKGSTLTPNVTLEWVSAVLSPNMVVVNEDGGEIDKAKFLCLAFRKDPTCRDHATACLDDPGSAMVDGHSFTFEEFS